MCACVCMIDALLRRLTEVLSCPLEVARQMTLIAHGQLTIIVDAA